MRDSGSGTHGPPRSRRLFGLRSRLAQPPNRRQAHLLQHQVAAGFHWSQIGRITTHESRFTLFKSELKDDGVLALRPVQIVARPRCDLGEARCRVEGACRAIRGAYLEEYSRRPGLARTTEDEA